MSRKFLSHLNLAKNELQNAIIQNLATAPLSPLPGQTYYNTTSGRLEFFGAVIWIDPTLRSNHTGTQPVASITGLAAIATSGSAADLGSGLLPAARFDDTAHGTRAGGTTHAAVIAAGASGFMTGADKTKLDGIAASATANSSDAVLLARANHTGTQVAATVSDLAAVVKAYRLDEFAVPITSVNVSNQKIINVANGVAASDAANFGQLTAAIASSNNTSVIKGSVRAATATNVNITTPGTTIDGLTAAVGELFWLYGQTVTTQNGPYVFNGSAAAMTRTLNWDTDAEASLGSYWIVQAGTSADRFLILSNDTAITLGSSTATVVFTSASTAYTAGNGLVLTGADFNVGAGAGILVTADAVAIDTSVVVRKFAAPIGAGTSVAISHNLNTLDVAVQVYEVADGATVDCDVVRNTVNQITLGFAVAVIASAFRVVVQG